MKTPDNQPSNPPKLIAGVDFIVENGLYVFTALYLKKRGYCCENNCRNCPYGFSKNKDSVKSNY